MLRFATLYSGSSGNCCAVISPSARILIDLGGSCKKTVEGLRELGVDPKQLDGVLITHEHIDHIAGCRVFLGRYDVPVFATEQTRRYLLEKGHVTPMQRFGELKGCFTIGDISVTPFATDHDSLSCRGFRLECGDSSIAVATDLGRMTEDVYAHLKGCTAVALESNYDLFRLRHGRYDRALQDRIASSRGHLSNDDCAGTVARLAMDGTRKVMLMHLSEENNDPALALTRCYGELEDRGLEELGVEVCAAPRHSLSEVWEF